MSILQALEMLNAPYTNGLRKLFWEILKEKYPAHEKTIIKICDVSTAQEYQEVVGLVTAVYEAAFFKAVQQQQESLAKLGYKVNIKPEPQPPPEGKKIFNRRKRAGSSK